MVTDIIALIIRSYFLVESEGLILTNAHVINKPRSSIQVGFCELSTCTGSKHHKSNYHAKSQCFNSYLGQVPALVLKSGTFHFSFLQ